MEKNRLEPRQGGGEGDCGTLLLYYTIPGDNSTLLPHTRQMHQEWMAGNSSGLSESNHMLLCEALIFACHCVTQVESRDVAYLSAIEDRV